MNLNIQDKYIKPLVFALIAIISSMAIFLSWEPISYDEYLIQIQAKNELEKFDPLILDEEIEIQAILLDYSVSQELMLKAWFAITKYPESSRQVLITFGSRPEFKEILFKHGDIIIPIIDYFMENGILLNRTKELFGDGIQTLTESADNLFSQLTGDTIDVTIAIPKTPDSLLTELQQIEDGWTAINYIKEDGFSFIGQFTLLENNKVTWNQTKRTFAGLTSFVAKNIWKLEEKVDRNEDLLVQDYFWAALDVVPVYAAFKVLKAGKIAARSTKLISGAGSSITQSSKIASKYAKGLTLSKRTVLIAGKVSKISKYALKKGWGKWGFRLAAGIIVINYPSIVSSLLATAAKAIGVPPWLIQNVGWFLIIYLLLFPFSWLGKYFLKGLLKILTWVFGDEKQELVKAE
jgi:hypothetical protein